ncbi:HPP family protein [Amphritea balenae]|uniref:HPP family protein n=1 Tax=Amphritea balenae TaxID=452629 RepID=A0A3P1SQP5_9GAMM|nr:HPP family protein [Amphritea balenae]RRC99379.1 HPP family protein [Amphritea balenae]GGK71632.1 membrane protein [Amphritea balenae]
MTDLLQKMRGDAAPLPAPHPVKNILLAGLGGFIAIAVLAGLADSLETVLIMGSFGASCVLVFGFPDAPFSQPRNVVAGHCISTLTGLVFLMFFGPVWWSVALAVCVAIMLMMASRTVHPPAGSNPVIVFLLQPGWDYLVFPTFTGALLLVLVALLYNNLSRSASYPKYW